jgi:hypothetical protein
MILGASLVIYKIERFQGKTSVRLGLSYWLQR